MFKFKEEESRKNVKKNAKDSELPFCKQYVVRKHSNDSYFELVLAQSESDDYSFDESESG
ncbi:MAG: hypothetical protein GX270_16230 [Clostridiaceae bacterium]|jgi:hypothetical protein|nr:hypothetical protein [Clostridiaceae bacterium]